MRGLQVWLGLQGLFVQGTLGFVAVLWGGLGVLVGCVGKEFDFRCFLVCGFGMSCFTLFRADTGC